jgi:hypothetical protein
MAGAPVTDLIDHGLIRAPITVFGTHSGKRIEARLTSDGAFVHRGNTYSSPSVAAGRAITAEIGTSSIGRGYLSINGWKFCKRSVRVPAQAAERVLIFPGRKTAPGRTSICPQSISFESMCSLRQASMLGTLAWPPEVDGAAIALERVVVPPEAESDLPDDPERAVEHLAAHPERRDVRLVVGGLRDGESMCAVRQRRHDEDGAVAFGPDLVPGLVHALLATLRD